MSSPDRKNSSNWKHPLPVSLLRKYGYEKSIEEIIEFETLTLTSRLENDRPSLLAQQSVVPIEAIASALDIRVTRKPCPASATLIQTLTGYEVSYGTRQHYYRQRFSLAHEVGHVVLSKLAGPFSNRDLHNSNGLRHEEEIICDLFASAILIPKIEFEKALPESDILSQRHIHSLARQFRVSKGAVLRRIALLQGCVLILWDYMRNPLKQKSHRAERITQVYPFASQLSKHFVPLYCTLNHSRFSPNIVLDSFHSGHAVSGYVRIEDLGSLAGREYFLQNVPFQKWGEDVLQPNIIRKPKHFFNMATFIRT